MQYVLFVPNDTTWAFAVSGGVGCVGSVLVRLMELLVGDVWRVTAAAAPQLSAADMMGAVANVLKGFGLANVA